MTDPYSTDAALQSLRRRLRNLRCQLTPAELDARGAAACANLLRISALRRARRVACYLPMAGEMDTWPLIHALDRRDRHCLLPVLHPFAGNRLLFRDWPLRGPLRANRFGIPEPDGRSTPVPLRAIDVIIVPLVAFDPGCRRLGMGGGFYDRTLWIRRVLSWRRPLLIGLAHDFQCVESLPQNATDVVLDYVVSESRLYQR